MRCFIGIQLSDCTTAIETIINELKLIDNNANYTKTENIHITIEFLGEIDVLDINKIQDIFSNLSYNSFTIHLEKIKNLKDMVVIEVKDNKSLRYLQSLLNKELRDRGFILQTRKYYPHVTLARKCNFFISEDVNLSSEIKEVILFSSDRINNELVYTPILRKKFK